MRTASTNLRAAFVSAVLVASFLACSTFGEGAASGPPGDAGSDPDADAGSADVLASDASMEGGRALPKTCAQRGGGAILCEDFESISLQSLAPWGVLASNGATVEIAESSTRGSRVLRATLAPTSEPGGADALLARALSFSPPFYVRFFAFVDDSTSEAALHIPFVLDNNELILERNRFLINQHNGEDVFMQMMEPVPTAKWVCVQWSVLPTQTTLFVDGAKVVEVSGKPLLGTDWVAIGLTLNAPFATTRSILLDDLLVSASPVGCD